LGLDFSLLSFYILTKGFSKEHISKISKDYAKTLILTSRVDIIEEVKKLSKNHDSIVISGAFYDYIDYFMTLLNVKFKAIYSSRIIYDTNNISMGKVDIVYTGKKKLLPLINYFHCSFISFGDSRYDLDLFNASSEVHLVYPKKRFKDSVTSKGWIIHD
jgi:phosphoserine phosphatase